MKVLERAAGHATGAYHVPAADIDAYAAYTNNIPCGAMRGFGVNQAAFGLECCLDDLCRQGGFDRWQFRYDNALQNGDVTSTGQIIEGGAGVRETLLAVKRPVLRCQVRRHRLRHQEHRRRQRHGRLIPGQHHH
jgi:aldehyde oxidoreductase